MTTFLYIAISGVAMSAIALIGSITLLLTEATLKKILLTLVAFAAGSMIGGALFHMLPTAIDAEVDALTIGVLAALGFFVFFVLEQFLNWQHSHETEHADLPGPDR